MFAPPHRKPCLLGCTSETDSMLDSETTEDRSLLSMKPLWFLMHPRRMKALHQMSKAPAPHPSCNLYIITTFTSPFVPEEFVSQARTETFSNTPHTFTPLSTCFHAHQLLSQLLLHTPAQQRLPQLLQSQQHCAPAPAGHAAAAAPPAESCGAAQGTRMPLQAHRTCMCTALYGNAWRMCMCTSGCGMTADTLEPIIAFENAGHCVITKKIVLENWFGNENVGPEVPEGRQELGMEATRCRT
eukprot:1158116-Pelagomonas_calceolata.AAC.3